MEPDQVPGSNWITGAGPAEGERASDQSPNNGPSVGLGLGLAETCGVWWTSEFSTSAEDSITLFDSLINNFINPRDGGVAAPATAARALELRARKKHVPAATLLQPVHGRTRARRARGQQTEVRQYTWTTVLLLLLHIQMLMELYWRYWVLALTWSRCFILKEQEVQQVGKEQG